MALPVRLRFAPSPTGMMHLGNVRSALLNYLFAQKKGGVLVLRIEDTDAERNFDPDAKNILKDLAWLGLNYDEGPIKGGPYAPYFQSQRTTIYQQKLLQLADEGKAYRCFCSHELLEKKRLQLQALRLPPRYDRACATLSAAQEQALLHGGAPFVWRLRMTAEGNITFQDLSKGRLNFDLRNFSDFPLTRQDGSFTFMFANCVDDVTMHISHVVRGEDHLTNTVGQVALYHAFGAPIPLFWHLPIITNKEGQKLSKRDFGFSLDDLRNSGFIPEAINNYLATIGSGTFDAQIMSLHDLAEALELERSNSAAQIKYDAEKLRWFNHQWIVHLTTEELAHRCIPFLEQAGIRFTDNAELLRCVRVVQPVMTTLAQSAELLSFCGTDPDIEKALSMHFSYPAATVTAIGNCIERHLAHLATGTFIASLKEDAAQHSLSSKTMFSVVRLLLTGQPQGLAISEIMDILGTARTAQRLARGVALMRNVRNNA